MEVEGTSVNMYPTVSEAYEQSSSANQMADFCSCAHSAKASESEGYLLLSSASSAYATHSSVAYPSLGGEASMGNAGYA